MHNEPDRILANAAVQADACLAGQPLGNIDIVNSQPALLAVLMHNTDSSIYDRHTFTPKVGVVGYNQLAASGRLYEHLMDRTGLSRREVKVGLLRDVLGRRRWYPSAIEDAFRESFPSVWQFVRKFNRGDHGALLRELQRVESDLVIQQVGSRLAGNGPFISLHDSVFCRRDELPVVVSAFEHAMDGVAFRLKLKAA